jgi:Protein of unknown function (DUF3179)
MERSAFRNSLWIGFAASALAGIAWFFVPAFIIRPFSHQSALGLSVAMALRQRAPWVTLAAAIVCLVLGWALWKASSRWRRIVLVAVMVVVAFSTVMARMNYFEWMFHPISSAQFENENASKLDQAEMVLAVKFDEDARAYPIREMAYHHILNDVVNGVPVAVTY